MKRVLVVTAAVVGAGGVTAEAFVHAPLPLARVDTHSPTRAGVAPISGAITEYAARCACSKRYCQVRLPSATALAAVLGSNRDEAKEETDGNLIIGGSSDAFSPHPTTTTAGRWTPGRALLSWAGAPPGALQAAVASAVLLVASTTEDDILAAMRGLDSSLGTPSSASKGQPTITLPANRNKEDSRESSSLELSSRALGDPGRGDGGRDGRAEAGGTLEGVGGELGLGGGTDLMRSLGNGPRQAGPLTHGF